MKVTFTSCDDESIVREISDGDILGRANIPGVNSSDTRISRSQLKFHITDEVIECEVLGKKGVTINDGQVQATGSKFSLKDGDTISLVPPELCYKLTVQKESLPAGLNLSPTAGEVPTVVLIGTTGCGKSSLGNVLLGKKYNDQKVFPISNGAQSCTEETAVKDGYWMGDGRLPCRVIDTPGLDNSDDQDTDHIDNIVDTLKMVDHIHMFLLVLHGQNPKFTSSIKSMLKTFEKLFAKNFWRHVVVTFSNWHFDERSVKARKRKGEEWESHAERRRSDFHKLFPKSKGQYLNILYINSHYLDNAAYDDNSKAKEIEMFNQMIVKLWDVVKGMPRYECSDIETVLADKDEYRMEIKNKNFEIATLEQEVQKAKEQVKHKEDENKKLQAEKQEKHTDLKEASKRIDELQKKNHDQQIAHLKEITFKNNEMTLIREDMSKKTHDIHQKLQSIGIEQKQIKNIMSDQNEYMTNLNERIDYNEEFTNYKVTEQGQHFNQLLNEENRKHQHDIKKMIEVGKRSEAEFKHNFSALFHPEQDQESRGLTLSKECGSPKKLGSPKLFKVPLENNGIIKDESGKVVAKKFKVPTANRQSRNKPTKTLLVMGMTGAGKSTLIDGMANFICDVRYEDDYRFQIIELTSEEKRKEGNQAMSQTDGISIYEFPWDTGSNIPYNLVIIDTPGFGDTRGIDRDKQLIRDIKYVFGDDKGCIETLDAVCFVTKAPDARLTAQQRFIFDNVLSVFGHDIEGNIFALLTFHDGQPPAALAALKEAKMPIAEHFLFNSQSIFANKLTTGPVNMKILSTNPNVAKYQLFYDSCNVFFRQLMGVSPKCLYMTKAVLEAREQIETEIAGLQVQVQNFLHKKDSLQQEIYIFEQHELQVSENENFTYTVEETKMTEITLRSGEYVTNCLHCNFTCHYPCAIPNDENKAGCAAMRNGSCVVCANKCHWSQHRNAPFRLEAKSEKVEKTYEEVKKKYEEFLEKNAGQKSIVDAMQNEANEISETIQDYVKRITCCLNTLSEIALRPTLTNATDYIDQMIQSEQMQQKPGYLARIQQLHIERKRAEELVKIQSGRNWDLTDINVDVINKARAKLNDSSPKFNAEATKAFTGYAKLPQYQSSPATPPADDDDDINGRRSMNDHGNEMNQQRPNLPRKPPKFQPPKLFR